MLVLQMGRKKYLARSLCTASTADGKGFGGCMRLDGGSVAADGVQRFCSRGKQVIW